MRDELTALRELLARAKSPSAVVGADAGWKFVALGEALLEVVEAAGKIDADDCGSWTLRNALTNLTTAIRDEIGGRDA